MLRIVRNIRETGVLGGPNAV